jgi:hypothetical protein
MSFEKIQQDKQTRWQEALRNVDTITDKLGMPVDEGIRETVAALHVFGIGTSGSHEGKIERHPAPYIDVTSEAAASLYEELHKMDKQEAFGERGKEIKDEIARLNFAEREKIQILLNEFNSLRNISEETKLGIEELALNWSRVQSNGAELQEDEADPQVLKERLDRFQKEMRAFTEFLKNKYFSN